MKRKEFTDQEVEILLKNENILKVGSSNVTYKPDFKIKAVKEYNNGKTPIQIFVEAGIAIDILGRENAKRSLTRWRNAYKKLGDKGLLEEQRGEADQEQRL
jgi:hydrogenase maturation factor